MNSKPYLLAVDDEQMNLNIIEDLLEADFDIHTVNNGRECLEHLNKTIPDIILLDVMMPELNGLDACKQIRANSNFKDIPVIFVSALASANERMNGYEVGGDDYLTKPFNEDELITKINLLLKNKTEKQNEIKEKDFATKTAMTSMVNASESGHLIYFMQSILAINEIKALHELISNVLAKYGLEGCVMLNHQEEPDYFFSDGRVRPIEQDILREAATQSQKIIEFSGRAIFNEKHVGLLIRNMPDDEEKAGRYKDHLAVLIDSLEAKLLQFIADQHERQNYQILKKTVESVSKELEIVNQSIQKQRAINSNILGSLVQNVENSFLKLGLDGSQEDELLGLITHAEVESDNVYVNGEQSAKTFDRIIVELNQLLL